MDWVEVPKHFHDMKFITKKWLRKLFSELEQTKKFLSLPDFTGRIAASIYLEPSISTEISFNIVLHKMNIRNLSYRSMNIEDRFTNPHNMLIRFEMQGIDLILLRSNDITLFDILKKMDIPTINCGCEEYGNPSETLQDLYTIWQRHRKMDNVKVLAIGDLLKSSSVDATFNLLEYIDVEIEKISLNDYKTVADFFREIDQKSENANVIYLLRDSRDRFINLTNTITGYSTSTWKIFEQVFRKLRAKNVLIINAGSKRLQQWFSQSFYKELFQSEKDRYRDGEIVRSFLIRKLLEKQ